MNFRLLEMDNQANNFLKPYPNHTNTLIVIGWGLQNKKQPEKNRKSNSFLHNNQKTLKTVLKMNTKIVL